MFLRISTFFVSGLLLALVGFSGCSGSSTSSLSEGDGAALGARPVDSTTAPYVEPMFPRDLSAKDESTGAFLTKSASFGKVGQQAIPLPPVADLVAQADDYLAKIGTTLEELDGTANYKKDADAVIRDASGLALVALAIGLSPEDSKYKKAAPGIIEAALALEKVEKLDAANKAYAALKVAFASSGDPTTLSWTKVADLGPVMKAVPNLDSAVKRLSNTESKLKKGPDKVAPLLAGLAAIAQGSMANFAETVKPDAEAEWKKECELFRDAAVKANAAVHDFVEGAATHADFQAAYDKLAETCDSCHKIFQPK